MSNNTNTLFWVITGAVIVLAVFVLINNSINNNLSNIISNFNSYWIDKKSDTPSIPEVDRYFSDNDNVSFIKYGEDTGYVQGLEVKVSNISQDSNSFSYYVKNVSSKTINDKTLHLIVHEYNSREVVYSFFCLLDYFSPNQQKNLTATALDNLTGEYYFELVYEE